MILTLTSATRPARDLGHLLRKHPERIQTFTLGFGRAHVFYPQADDERCTAALLLDIDPIGLVRGKPGSSSETAVADTYINDRPYVASSFLSVAIARVFGSALGGRSDRDDLVKRELELEASVTPVRADEELAARLFAPLGFHVESGRVTVPEAARAGRHMALTISGTTTLARLLSALYVLIPVLDAEKHYWVGEEEVDKLFRHGGSWLASHPERETIARRYLKRAPKLANAAVARLATLEAVDPNVGEEFAPSSDDGAVEKPLRLQHRRIDAALEVLQELGARTIGDLGCGGGDLVLELARSPWADRILAMDVSIRELDHARDRLEHAPISASRRERVTFAQSSVLYADKRLKNLDAITLLEVIEHVDEDRLPSLERAVFGSAHPRAIIVTTPNAEHNVRFPALADGGFRHSDHRFEWSRDAFRSWAERVAQTYEYNIAFRAVGDHDAQVGAPTQMAVFRCN